MRPIGAISLAPRFRLSNDQLAQVLCQIRFSPVLRIRQDDAVIPFQEAIRQRYPRYAKQQGVQIMLTPQGVQQQNIPDAQHRFDDSDGTFAVVLTPEFIALETKSYADIDDFAERLVELVQAVQDHYAPAEILRLGLRFINEIRLSGPDAQTEMREAISPCLLGALGADELSGALTSGQQMLELDGEQSRLIVRHGLNPLGGTTVDLLAGQTQQRPELGLPFYLLDLDAFSEQTVRYSVEGIETRVRDFNDDIRSFFAWGVSEEYRRERLGQTDL